MILKRSSCCNSKTHYKPHEEALNDESEDVILFEHCIACGSVVDAYYDEPGINKKEIILMLAQAMLTNQKSHIYYQGCPNTMVVEINKLYTTLIKAINESCNEPTH